MRGDSASQQEAVQRLTKGATIQKGGGQGSSWGRWRGSEKEFRLLGDVAQ